VAPAFEPTDSSARSAFVSDDVLDWADARFYFIESVSRPGRVNLIGLAMLLAAAAGVYWVVIVGPLYMERFDVVDEVSAAFNQLLQQPPDRVRNTLTVRLEQIGQHSELNDEGQVVVVKGLGLSEDQITVELTGSVRQVSVTYSRQVVLVPTDKVHTETFTVTKTGNIGK
jgi:hypothetical protein